MTKRLHTLEEVNNNVKLLSEMLLHYSKEDSSEADKELMKVAPRHQAGLRAGRQPAPGACSGEDAAAHLMVPNLPIRQYGSQGEGASTPYLHEPCLTCPGQRSCSQPCSSHVCKHGASVTWIF